MEVLMVLIGVLALALLAMRYGYDSRDTTYSKEHEFARCGMVWDVRLLRLEDLRREADLWRRMHRHEQSTLERIPFDKSAALRRLVRRLSESNATGSNNRKPTQFTMYGAKHD